VQYKPKVVVESASARFGKLVGEHRLGVVITIRGSKPPSYTLEQMKLHVLGNEVRTLLKRSEEVCGELICVSRQVWGHLPSPMVWVIQRSFLPLPLSPDFCDVDRSFLEGSDRFV
jgi:hypothetical protein